MPSLTDSPNDRDSPTESLSPDESAATGGPTASREPSADAESRAPAGPNTSGPAGAQHGGERAADDAAADPRLNAEYTHTVPGTGDDHDVTLVGAVHDHPASAYRAREVVGEREPTAVALEIPPLALPLYLNYAEDARSPPAFGGEMSAAAQAARECDADVVGVDAPRRGFLAHLVRNCRREEVSAGTLRRVLSGTASVTRHALACRAAAVLGDRTGLQVEVDSPVEHDCDRTDSPEVQARDERRQADRSLSLLRAFDPPRPVELRDATREECMADRIRSLRRDGDVVAVVGLDHLDGLSELLEEEANS